MNLLALDQSSRITGWAVFKDGKLEEFGKISLDHPDVGVRLNQLRNKIDAMIDKFEINEIIFEDIQLQSNVANNVQTFKTLAEVYGVLYELATARGIKNSAVLASSWKSTHGIKGKVRADQKRAAQAWVLENYGVKPTQDEADAIAIGAHHLKKDKCAWSK